MATFAEIKAEIAVDINRTDLTTQINQAVLDAVEYHAQERFWFNETREATFNTIDGTSDYLVTSSLLGTGHSDFITIDYLQLAVSSTNKHMLERICPEEMEELLVGAPEGQSSCYAYYNLRFRLYPIPDAIYAVRVAGHYLLTALSASGDSNAWTNAARNLIRATARKFLYHRNIKDYNKAQMAEADEMRELERLRGETNRRRGTGGRFKGNV
jgi:hypothetical protein